MEWMSIEIAPRDGMAILTYMPPLPNQGRGRVNIQKWKGEPVGWVNVGHTERRRTRQPTHWMFLPGEPSNGPAPSTAEGVGG